MAKKLLFFSAITSIIIYFSACTTGQYDISDATKQDSIEASNNTVPVTTGPKKETNYRVRTAPDFTLQVIGAFNYGLGELSTSFESVFQAQQLQTGENFGVRRGFGIFISGKRPMNPEGNFRLIGTLMFHKFENNKLTSKFSSNGSVDYTLFGLGAGIENSFTPTFRLKPFVGGSVMFNMISGNAKIINDDGSESNYKFKNSFRIGLNINTGLEYLISNNMGMSFGINLVAANMFLKSSNSSDDSLNIPIRDKTVSNTPPFSGYKQFIFTSFYLGMNFYFGVKEKRFKI